MAVPEWKWSKCMSSSHHSGVKGSEWGRERRAERQEMVEETMATRMEDRGRTARWYSSGGKTDYLQLMLECRAWFVSWAPRGRVQKCVCRKILEWYKICILQRRRDGSEVKMAACSELPSLSPDSSSQPPSSPVSQSIHRSVTLRLRTGFTPPLHSAFVRDSSLPSPVHTIYSPIFMRTRRHRARCLSGNPELGRLPESQSKCLIEAIGNLKYTHLTTVWNIWNMQQCILG